MQSDVFKFGTARHTSGASEPAVTVSFSPKKASRPIAPKAVPSIAKCPVAGSFDFPVGPPNAKGYYNAQPFGKNDHLGEDWNGRKGGNSDLGDPIYSIADGIVVFAEDAGGGWGNVVRICHNIGTGKKPFYIDKWCRLCLSPGCNNFSWH